MSFRLRFPKADIPYWASQYDDDDVSPAKAGGAARKRGYLTRAEFMKLTRWKTPRTQPSCAKNDEAFITDVTGVALSTSNERLAIESLTLLDGVSWPTASVILHFCSLRKYPILDYRALWSLRSDAKPEDYCFPLWWEYVEATRKLSDDLNVTMRTVDRALWTFSKKKQG